MRVLVLEDDRLMQELLATLLRGLDNSVQVLLAETVEAGLNLWREQRVDLLLCDWNLPGNQTGLDLIKIIRAEDAKLPILVITGQADRVTVTQCARYKVNDFIVKPFDAETVMQRLRQYVVAADKPLVNPTSSTSYDELINWVGQPEKDYARLTVVSATQSALDLFNQSDKPSVMELANKWKADTAVTTRLLYLANSSLMRRHGKSVTNVLEAVSSLGVDMAISQIVAVSLQIKNQMSDDYLQELAEKYTRECNEVADQAAVLAKRLKLNITLCYTAGLLMRLGEFALLGAIQQFVDAGNQVAPADIDACIKQLASRYGNFLKVKWHMPISLRERIGATYKLSEGSVNSELLVMRIAAYIVHQQTQATEFNKLCRQVGILPTDISPASESVSTERSRVSGPPDNSDN